MRTPRFFQLTIALAALVLSGCASFERKWSDVRSMEKYRGNGLVVEPRDPFTGRWDGRWTSAKHRTASGYAGGRLRCILTKVDDRHYEARFKANWLIFASGYTTVFDVERRGRELRLSGEHPLAPMFGGVYKYVGRVAPEHFTASYDSTYDQGTLEMRRPQSGR